MARVSPTVPGDENVGQPASGDPSAPPLEYEGQPNFSTGAEMHSNAEVAHEIAEAGNGGDDPDDDSDGGLVNPEDNTEGEPHSQVDAGEGDE